MHPKEAHRPKPTCLICSGVKLVDSHSPSNFITRDHIVPRVGLRDHGLVLGPLAHCNENKIRVCRTDHEFIDSIKIRHYTTRGLSGLLEFIARGYPRPINTDLRNVQAEQFIGLFTEISRLCTRRMGELSPVAVGFYHRLGDRAGFYAKFWEQNGLPPVSIDMYRRVW